MERWMSEDYARRMAAADLAREASDAVRTLLREHPGPWTLGELEDKVLDGGDRFPVPVVRTALWGLLDAGELRFGERLTVTAAAPAA